MYEDLYLYYKFKKIVYKISCKNMKLVNLNNDF